MLRTLAIIVPFMFGLVYAQFDFFGNMFGQQQQQQQQQHRSGASQWAAHVESGTSNLKKHNVIKDLSNGFI
jgi:hypothetical protein